MQMNDTQEREWRAFTMLLTEELHYRLRVAALAEECSMAEIARRALDAYLRESLESRLATIVKNL